MRKRTGSIVIAQVNGVPIYLHWSFPAGAIIPMGFAHFELVPSLFLCAGYVLLVAVHELGHLAAAHGTRHRVFSIEISGAGGQCWTEAPRNRRAELLIYSGGLLAQLALFLLGAMIFPLLDDFRSHTFSYLVITCTVMNAAMFIVNLIPSRGRSDGLPTDGYVLWKALKRQWRERA